MADNAGGGPVASFLERQGETAPGGNGRDQAEGDPGHEGDGECEQQDRAVDRDLAGPGREPGGEADEEAKAAGLGEVRAEYKVLDGGNVINDAMLSGALDAVAGGLAALSRSTSRTARGSCRSSTAR